MTSKWKCLRCGTVTEEEHLLTCQNPFNTNETLTGCPHCKQIDEGFMMACDEPGCCADVWCGWTDKSTGIYRMTCMEHSEKNDL